jgi:Protein of unknown function (DUF421)
MSQLREQGIKKLDDVKEAFVEGDGSISIIKFKSDEVERGTSQDTRVGEGRPSCCWESGDRVAAISDATVRGDALDSRDGVTVVRRPGSCRRIGMSDRSSPGWAADCAAEEEYPCASRFPERRGSSDRH